MPASSSGASGSSRRPRPAARSAALSGWTKFASLLVAPLWLTYPGPAASRRFLARLRGRDARGLLRRAARAEPAPRAARLLGPDVRAGRSDATRRGRSGTGGSTTRAGSPTCTSCSACCRCCSSPARSLVAFFPRRKSPLQLAALTAALLAGFELVLTYWLYTYIPWFYPFAAIALLAPRGAAPEPVTAVKRDADELDRRSPGRRRCSRRRRPRSARRLRRARTEPVDASASARSRARPSRRSPSRAAPSSRRRVTAAVPPGRTRASFVCMCVCVPITAVTRPSSQRAIATFSLVASAWKSRMTTGAARARRPRARPRSPTATPACQEERAEQVQHRDLDAVARLDDRESAAGRPRARVRRPDHALARGEVVRRSRCGGRCGCRA